MAMMAMLMTDAGDDDAGWFMQGIIGIILHLIH
jgi:hypothetical protein